jgi:hypothetical protein
MLEIKLVVLVIAEGLMFPKFVPKN